MKNTKAGKLVSLAARRRKLFWNKVCMCRIGPICLEISMGILLLLGVCMVLDVLWWHSVDLLLYAPAISALAIYGLVIILLAKGVSNASPHRPGCPKGSLTNNQRS